MFVFLFIVRKNYSLYKGIEKYFLSCVLFLGDFFFLSFRLMLPSAAHNLSSLPLSHDWIGCFFCKDAVMMIAFVKSGVELGYICVG